MATFVSLINWTEQGIQNFRDTTKRADAFKQLLEQHGGKLIGLWWTLGEYDIVVVSEAPDDETHTAIALQLGSLGSVRTQTLRAFTRNEIEQVIAKAG
jgi:uncharacterized protein with GYD domain